MEDIVALVFRKKNIERQSIEVLFKPIEDIDKIRSYRLPCDLSSLCNFFRILIFSFKIKEKYIHITGDVHYLAFLLFWKKTILTVHDCNAYLELKGIKRFIVGLLWFKLPFIFANRIVFISPFSKKQIMQFFKVKEDKIKIIPNSFRTIPKATIQQKTKEFNILTIGTKSNKNIESLFKIIPQLENVKLHIVGRLNSHQKFMLEENNIVYSNYVDIDEQKLFEVYNNIDMLYFVSFSEGFGLPILEAQSCGIPVLTSNITSMPYVAGNGAILVNPYNLKEIKSAILKIKNDDSFKKELIRKGYLNIKRFDEETFIRSYMNLYNEVNN